MSPTPPDPPQTPAEIEPGWERRPSETEAFAAPAHDPRDIITPHAFRIAPSLLGLPLATPTRRALAMAIDGTLVLVMANSGGVLLALVIAVFAYGWLKNRFRPQHRIVRGVSGPARMLVVLLIFAIAAGLLQPLWERYVDDEDEDHDAAPAGELTLSGAGGLALGATALALQACDDAECRRGAVQGMAAVLAESQGEPATKQAKIDALVDEATDNPAERAQLKTAAAQALAEDAQTATAKADAALKQAAAAPSRSEEREEPEYSLLKQATGLLDDLGLSAGWAAVYFTLFTTLWAGQTPGKRLLRIRVVHLSGKPMSYWASFGRYGGYAAGLTTGLLGFAQIYWDPNRQAIQDQLSFTAVIRDVDLAALQPAREAG